MAAKMAATIRPDMVKSFSGDGDIEGWLSKIELVAKLTHIEDVASFIPLYLEGGALAVYLEMDDDQKTDVEAIKRSLREAFADGQFAAYARLREFKWTGEAVDVYANEIRRLAKLSGFTGNGLDQITKLAFVSGFPDSIGLELQQTTGVEGMKVADLIGRARVLAKNPVGVAAPAVRPMLTSKDRDRAGVKCFRCGGPHFQRDCPEQRKRQIICFRCGEKGHLSYQCNHGERDRQGGDDKNTHIGDKVSACGSVMLNARYGCGGAQGVPVIRIVGEGKRLSALVDTGCSHTMIRARHVAAWTGSVHTRAVDGRSVECKGTAAVKLEVAGEIVESQAVVVDEIVGNIDVVIGMDIIEKLGGVTVGDRTVQFGRVACAVVNKPQERAGQRPGNITIQDKDFEAYFDGNVWTVTYFWKDGQTPQLRNKKAMYDNGVDESTMERFNAEVDKWIEDGILMPWEGEAEGVIPLMAVEQPNKNKVRPVLDFRELNRHVECHTGDDLIDVCADRMREWRKIEGEPKIVDLSAAYLQLHVSKDLWKHQLVRYKGRVYCLTRVGFGLNSAPRIMTKVLKTVLAQSEQIDGATSSYIDDILVDVTKLGTGDVISHLAKYGLVAKPAMQLEGGTALGLKLEREGGHLEFRRNGTVPIVDKKLTKRELFSVCGKLVGHYPVGGWLRIACSFVKRHSEGTHWNEYIGDKAQQMIQDVIERVRKNDPVRGRWGVRALKEGVVWCDASSLGMGAVVEMDGVVVEDGAWMRKSDDFHHINVAELEAVLKGVNLGIKWGLERITIVTDSATVSGWIRLVLSEERRVKTSGAAEILVKRRLGTLKTLVQEMGLDIQVELVPSKHNKADVLTRVNKEWMLQFNERGGVISAAATVVKDLHDQHHMGVERTWYLAKEIDPLVTKNEVREVVRSCEKCQSIDPAPLRHDIGELGVDTVWKRLAVDITHFRGLPYLTVVDCGPGRFTIWRALRGETAQRIIDELDQIFMERGPVAQVLMDNATAFRSEQFTKFLNSWNVEPYYRAAYRPSGNGIVERNHRIIKAMAERANISPMEAAFFFNSAPRDRQKEETIPHRSVFKYTWRQPSAVESVRMPEQVSNQVRVGEEVWVKPSGARCTTQWDRGVVTGINSPNNIEVNQVPRHILDIRRMGDHGHDGDDDDVESGRDDIDAGDMNEADRYPRRSRRTPLWHDDYIVD